MAVTSPGDIVEVVRSGWPDVVLSDAQERLYAEYLEGIDPDALRRALPALVAEWDHPAPPGIMRAAAGARSTPTRRRRTWIAIGVAAGTFIVVVGGMLGAATVLSGGGGSTTTSVAATGALSPARPARAPARHVVAASTHHLVPARPCASFYDATLGGVARIEFGARGTRAVARYVTTPPDPRVVNCTSARRVVRDLAAGKGTSVRGARAAPVSTLVDGWKCVSGAVTTICTKGAVTFVAGTDL
jgi:hypothetical protein